MARLADYGPGDEITWGEPTGHPNDPRTEERVEPVPLTPAQAARRTPLGMLQSGAQNALRDYRDALEGMRKARAGQGWRSFWLSASLAQLARVRLFAARGELARRGRA